MTWEKRLRSEWVMGIQVVMLLNVTVSMGWTQALHLVFLGAGYTYPEIAESLRQAVFFVLDMGNYTALDLLMDQPIEALAQCECEVEVCMSDGAVIIAWAVIQPSGRITFCTSADEVALLAL